MTAGGREDAMTVRPVFHTHDDALGHPLLTHAHPNAPWGHGKSHDHNDYKLVRELGKPHRLIHVETDIRLDGEVTPLEVLDRD